LKQLIVNSKAVESIWKQDKAEKTNTNNNATPQGSRKAAIFIPDSYSDPTASTALRNLMRDEERQEQKKHKDQRRNNK